MTWAPTPSDAVEVLRESFDASPSDHFLGSGERGARVDLRGTIQPLKVWNECESNKPTPFVISSAGWGLLVHDDPVGRLAFPLAVDGPATHCELGTAPCAVDSGVAAIQVCVKASTMRYNLFAGTPTEIVAARAEVTGRPLLPPREQLALTQWRDETTGAAQILDDVAQMRARRIPVGWVILDNPWEVGGCIGSLTFDRKRFPDPAGLVSRLRALDVRLMLWVSPVVDLRCQAPEHGKVIRGSGTLSALDLTDRPTLEAFVARLKALLELGVAGFKGDRGDEVDLERQQLAGGWGTLLHNRYARLFAEAAARAAREVGTPGFSTLFRAASTGSERAIPGFWGGDRASSFAGLEGALRRAQTAGLSGFSTWGTDIGGYVGERLTTEVLIRWAQFGAVLPVMKIGGIGANARFWELGDLAVEGVRRAAGLHQSLHPYHYELARRAARTGLPILRPLALVHPDDPRAWATDDELLVGTDLLAAPLTRSGTTADVYLPAGTWIDTGTGETIVGPKSLRRRTPLLDLPLYLRGGSAIPFDLRLPIWPRPWTLTQLTQPGRGGWLVAAQAPLTRGSSSDHGRITVRRGSGTLEVSVQGARRETQVVLLGEEPPVSVTIDGRRTAGSPDVASLRRRATGWLVRDGEMPGIVLKLRPRGGSARASIALAPSEIAERSTPSGRGR